MQGALPHFCAISRYACHKLLTIHIYMQEVILLFAVKAATKMLFGRSTRRANDRGHFAI